MKDKKIIYFSAFLAVLIVIAIILLILNLILTGSFIIKIDSASTALTLMFSIIVVVIAIGIVQMEHHKQIAILRSVEVNKVVSVDDLENLNLDLYSSVIDKLSENQWYEICGKYYELKQQEQKNKQSQQKQEYIDKQNDEITKLKDTILEKLK